MSGLHSQPAGGEQTEVRHMCVNSVSLTPTAAQPTPEETLVGFFMLALILAQFEQRNNEKLENPVMWQMKSWINITDKYYIDLHVSK